MLRKQMREMKKKGYHNSPHTHIQNHPQTTLSAEKLTHTHTHTHIYMVDKMEKI